MDGAGPAEQLMQVLAQERDAIVADLVRAVRRKVPAYAAVPTDELTQRLGLVIDSIITSLNEHDPTVLTHYLEERTRWRLGMGMPIEAQLAIADLADGVLHTHLRRALAEESAMLAHALRRVETLASTSRHVMSRVHLAQVLHPPGL